MKYTIHGFQQEGIIKLGLTHDQCLVLRWFVDFQVNGMKEHVVDNVVYYWVNYQTVLDDLAVLRVKKQRIAMLFKDLVTAGVLKHFNLKQGGNYSYYTFGENYSELLTERESNIEPSIKNNTTLYKKIDNPSIKNNTTLYKKVSNKDSSIKDTSIKKQNKAQDTDILFGEFYDLYPKKQGKQSALKAYQKALKQTTHENIIHGVKNYKAQIASKNTEMQYIKQPATWLNAGCWEDDYGIENFSSHDSDQAPAVSFVDNFKHAVGDKGYFIHNGEQIKLPQITQILDCSDTRYMLGVNLNFIEEFITVDLKDLKYA